MTGFQKLVKGFAILIAVCVVMLIIGISIALICLFSVSTENRKSTVKSEITVDVDPKTEQVKPDIVIGDIQTGIAKSQTMENGGPTWEYSYEVGEIDSIEISNDIGELRIEATDEPKIRIEGEHISASSSIELHGKKLYIKNMPERIVLFGINIAERVDSEEAELVVYIPENYELEKLIVSNALGEVEIEDQMAKWVDFTNSFGKFEATGIKAERVNLKGGVEDISIEMNANILDYDMKLIPGAGGIYIDGIEQEKINHTNQDAEKRFTAEGALGSIRIEFDPED